MTDGPKPPPEPSESAKLREALLASLRAQGYATEGGKLQPPKLADKPAIRRLHELAVRHRIESARGRLSRHEEVLLSWIADGSDVDPLRVTPQIVPVTPRSTEELLFRYAALHWSIPVSSGYGRRLRLLVIDQYNGKLIGLVGLADPVFALQSRDQWIGWTLSDRKARLRHVMDAFVLGAVPPYSQLLFGKLVALLVTTTELQDLFQRKYSQTTSLISDRQHSGTLALITTTSALGRSAIYNRLNVDGKRACVRLGWTKGSGDVHFTNGLYSAILSFAEAHCVGTAKNPLWGGGFRNRREVLKKTLSTLGISTEWLYHGVRREVFAFPLAHNSREFLCGHASTLEPVQRNIAEVMTYFQSRWLIDRAANRPDFRTWRKEDWRLWP